MTNYYGFTEDQLRRDCDGVVSAFVEITPKIAREMLRANEGNREFRESVVKKHVDSIVNGRWEDRSASPIMFDRDGYLMNGQHRLMAVVRSDRSIFSDVKFNVPRSAMEYIDADMKVRTGYDLLGFLGFSTSETRPFQSFLNVYIPWTEGRIVTSTTRINPLPRIDLKNAAVRNRDLLPFAMSGKRIAAKLGTDRSVPAGAVGVALFEFSKISKDLSDELFHRLIEYEFNGSNDPVTALSRALTNQDHRHARNESARCLYQLFRTWNALAAKEPLKQIKSEYDGDGFQIPRLVAPRP